MDYLEEKILYMDIGVKFIKILFIKVNWQKIKTIIYSTKIPTCGISINGIENFQLFMNTINEALYQVEYETSSKIQKVFILYGFFARNFFTYNYTININKPIDKNHLNQLHKNTLIDIKYKILHYNYYFILDHYFYTLNPLEMLCKFLSIKQNYLLISNLLHENITNIFEKNSVEILNSFSCIYVLAEYIKRYYSNFVIIDGGYYNTRISIIENNMIKEFYNINIGTYHLLQNISLKYKLSLEESYQISFKEGLLGGKVPEIMKINQVYLNNIIDQSLSIIKSSIINSLDIPIFLNGWSNLNPVEYYLKNKYNRDIFSVKNFFDWPENMEFLYAFLQLENN
jgi:cell division ATPase FtsA